VARGRASLAIVVAFIALSARAAAEPSDPDRALATELFKEGRALIAAGKTEEACARFEESERLDPSGGTLLNLALCHESLGKTATAWSEMNEALSMAKRDRRDDRIAIASARLAALEPKLARIVLVVSAEANADGLVIARDGSTVSRTAWGIAMPVDPGAHGIIARAPNKRAWSVTIEARAAETVRVDVPALEAEPAPPAQDVDTAPGLIVEPLAVEAVAPPPPLALPPRPRSEQPSRTQTILGYGLGTLGLASLGVGTGFGIDAINQRKDSDRGCPTSTTCSQQAFDANERAKRSADVSTVLISAGAVALLVGVYLVVANGSRADHF
jgi:hypothetical protein